MKMSSFSLLSLFFSLFILSLVSAHPWDNFHNLPGSRLGDTNPAIVDLKKYLHHFGYLKKSQHHTDSFDDELHVALRRYQQYFNLEVTGVIDPPTTRLLTTPRCGAPDIVDTPGGGKLHYSFRNKPTWPPSRRDLKYSFDNTYHGIGLFTLSNIIIRAFRRWQNVSDFKFTGVQPYGNPDITIGFYRGNHGDGFPFDGRGGALAHAFPPQDGRLHFDADEDWSPDVRTATSQYAMDLESVSVHEMGHLLGLNHSTDRNAVMFPSILPLTRKVDLGTDDILGLKILYGYQPLYATY